MHIWKIQRILSGIHILFIKFGIYLTKLFEFENWGLFCNFWKFELFQGLNCESSAEISIWKLFTPCVPKTRVADSGPWCHGGTDWARVTLTGLPLSMTGGARPERKWPKKAAFCFGLGSNSRSNAHARGV